MLVAGVHVSLLTGRAHQPEKVTLEGGDAPGEGGAGVGVLAVGGVAAAGDGGDAVGGAAAGVLAVGGVAAAAEGEGVAARGGEAPGAIAPPVVELGAGVGALAIGPGAAAGTLAAGPRAGARIGVERGASLGVMTWGRGGRAGGKAGGRAGPLTGGNVLVVTVDDWLTIAVMLLVEVVAIDTHELYTATMR